jgi:hypothetical protein
MLKPVDKKSDEEQDIFTALNYSNYKSKMGVEKSGRPYLHQVILKVNQ